MSNKGLSFSALANKNLNNAPAYVREKVRQWVDCPQLFPTSIFEIGTVIYKLSSDYALTYDQEKNKVTDIIKREITYLIKFQEFFDEMGVTWCLNYGLGSSSTDGTKDVLSVSQANFIFERDTGNYLGVYGDEISNFEKKKEALE